MNELAEALAGSLEGKGRIILHWADDEEDIEPGVPRIQLTWGDEPGYYAPDIEGPDWMEQRRQHFGR
jgi:hypothetical protein